MCNVHSKFLYVRREQVDLNDNVQEDDDDYNALRKLGKGTFSRLPIARGNYTVETFETLLKDYLKDWTGSIVENDVTGMISFHAGNYSFDFTPLDSAYDTLGLTRDVCESNQITHGQKPHLLSIFRTFKVSCNLAEGSYDNGLHTHNIYEFSCPVKPYEMINEAVANVIYYPLLSHSDVSTLHVTIKDEYDNLIDFGPYFPIRVRLHLVDSLPLHHATLHDRMHVDLR